MCDFLQLVVAFSVVVVRKHRDYNRQETEHNRGQSYGFAEHFQVGDVLGGARGLENDSFAGHLLHFDVRKSKPAESYSEFTRDFDSHMNRLTCLTSFY